ncbi:HET-domain-containing protein, partial [Periconia macrospinosa]
PTRLIDVGSNDSPELRLRDGNQCSGHYVTLSYCWGKKIHNRTTKSTLHASMAGLDISTLCKTIQDAVIVTRNLQLKYLWIDALCIIQDDPEDWEREAMSMSEVYAQSAITIAATSSADSHGGLFFPRSAGPTAQLLWSISERCPPERVSFRSHTPVRYVSLVEKGPLNQRGWVLQERTLSKRIVHYTTDRLYWDCQQSTSEEGFTEVVNYPDRLPAHRFKLASIHGKTKTSEEMHWLDNSWRSLVERYTQTQLTYKSDRLPALAGLAKTWAKVSGDRYIAGCWMKNLPLSLLWTTDLRTESTELLQRPSWSWVSFDGPVRFRS